MKGSKISSGFGVSVLEILLLFSSPFAFLLLTGLEMRMEIPYIINVIIAKVVSTGAVFVFAFLAIMPIKKLAYGSLRSTQLKVSRRKKNELTTMYVCCALPIIGLLDYVVFSDWMNLEKSLKHALVYTAVGLLSGSISTYKLFKMMRKFEKNENVISKVYQDKPGLQ